MAMARKVKERPPAPQVGTGPRVTRVAYCGAQPIRSEPMRVLVIVAGAFVMNASAEPVAQPDARALPDREMEKREAIFQRVRELYPRRRDTPLRDLNITDNEVREIQRLAAGVHLVELVNISPVVTGCACEEGPDCTEQVNIVGRYKDRFVEVQLSRLRNRWSIGRVQRWWLEYAALQAREPLMDRREYEKARNLRVLEFPMCPDGAARAADAPATKRSIASTDAAATKK